MAFATPVTASARFRIRESIVKRIGKNIGGVKEKAEEKANSEGGALRDKEGPSQGCLSAT